MQSREQIVPSYTGGIFSVLSRIKPSLNFEVSLHLLNALIVLLNSVSLFTCS